MGTEHGRAKHPGKSAAQRRVLDEIGGGNHSPIMVKATRDAMLRVGLIGELEPKRERVGRFQFVIRQFDMPIPVHMQWCEAMSEPEEDAHE